VDAVVSDRSRMPSLFIGHGTPLNALADNRWTRAWARIGQQVDRPRAILAVSAHWCTHGVAVTAMHNPPTIHDFGGFSNALHQLQYPAPGDPALAERVQQILAPMPVALDREAWGLDHGVWSVLLKAYPAADIPVIQLSIDVDAPSRFHFDVGRRLAPLRDEGVLVFGTGNVVHNLRAFRRYEEELAYDWAISFNTHIREAVLARRFEALIDYEAFGDAARLSVPTPEHYYPLLYVAGAAADDPATIEIDGVGQGAMSMLSVAFGRERASAGKSAAEPAVPGSQLDDK
jgi:4,5-DOPA dioxygenase extradiol